jgi:type II secretory pathway pseudopilin PulG
MRAFNLIPADERNNAAIDTGKSGGGALVVLGLLGVLAVFALLYGSASRQISSQRSQVATLHARTQLAEAQAARLSPYVSFMSLHEQRVQAVDQLVDSRFDWAHAFHEIGRVLPKDASLSSLSGTIGSSTGSTAAGADTAAGASKAASAAAGATTPASGSSGAATASSSGVTSATPAGSVPTFTLSGCATSQAEVALTLDRLRLIDGVSEVTLQSSTKAGGSGGGGGSSSAGGCKGSQPAFAMQIIFDPLPTPSATSSQSAASTVSASSTSSASALTPSTGQPTTSTGGAR